MKPRFSSVKYALLKAAPALIVISLSSGFTQAANKYWDLNSTTPGLGAGASSWDLSATNWNTATAGTAATVAFVNGDDAFFQTAGVNAVTLGANLTANSISQSATGTATTINSGAGTQLTLTAGNLSNTGNSALTINPNIVLGGTGSIYSSATANTITLAGVVSGSNLGFKKIGVGPLVLTNAGNTYSGASTINQGTVSFAGSAASGTPIGTGNLVLAGSGSSTASNSSSLVGFAPTTASGSVSYTGGTSAGSTLTFSNTGYVLFTQGTTSDLTYNFGPGSGAVLNRSGKGVLVISTGTSVPTTTTLGSSTGSRLLINGTTPAMTNGMVAPYYLGAANGSAGAGIFLTYGGDGFTPVTYDVTGSDLTSSTSTSKASITGAATISSNASTYSLAINAATALDSGVTVTVGDNGSTPAGLILNSGLSGGTVDFGASEGIVYVGGTNQNVSTVFAGSAGLTKTQYNGTNGTLTLSGVNTYTGDTNVQAGQLVISSVGSLATGSNISVNAANIMGSAAYNLTNNGTIGGNLNISGPKGGFVYQVNTTQQALAGSVLLNDGSSTSASKTITVDGALTVAGSGLISLGTIASTGTGTTGTGAIFCTNTGGNTLGFANGTSLVRFAPSNNCVGTLNTVGTVNLFSYGQANTTGTTVAVPFDITFGSGTWNIGQVGQNNTGAQTGGTTTIKGGAVVNLAAVAAGVWPGQGASQGGQYMHGIYNIGGATTGTLSITGTLNESNGAAVTPQAGAINGLQINVGNQGSLSVSGTTALGMAVVQTGVAGTNSITINPGGSSTLTGAVTLGGNLNNATFADTNTLDVAGGTLTVANSVNVGGATNTAATNYSNNFNISGGSASVVNLALGSANTAASNTVANTVNLSGGKLVVSGSTGITAGVGTNQTNVFNWTAGRLAAFKITPGARFTTPGSGGISTTGLINSGGTLAPGDVGTAGNTTIAGDYTQQASGTLAIDIAGSNQTGAFQNLVNSYDNVLLNGATTANLSLNGNLQVSLVGFTPANGETYTIIRSAPTTLAVSGAFANVAFGARITTQGGEGTFLVSNTVSGITLSDFLSSGNTYASWIGGFNVGGFTAPNDDFDNDNLDNVVENVLGSNPSVYSNGLTQISATANSVKFRHDQSNTIASDVTKTYQWSPDLVNWAASGVSIGGTTATIAENTITDVAAPANDVIEVTVTVTAGPATKVFGRLVSTKTP